MQTWNYTTNHGASGPQCGYVFRKLNGKPVLIVVQTPASKPSVTNKVEEIVNGILAGPLLDEPLSELRIFTRYPNPVNSIEEFAFQIVKKPPEKKNILNSLLAALKYIALFGKAEGPPQPYIVWNMVSNPNGQVSWQVLQDVIALDPVSLT